MMDRHQAGFNRMSRLSAREAIEWQTGALAVSFGHWLASLTVPWGRSQFLNVVVLALFDCVTYGLSCQLPACLVQPDCCYQPFYEVIGAPEDLDGCMDDSSSILASLRQQMDIPIIARTDGAT